MSECWFSTEKLCHRWGPIFTLMASLKTKGIIKMLILFGKHCFLKESLAVYIWNKNVSLANSLWLNYPYGYVTAVNVGGDREFKVLSTIEITRIINRRQKKTIEDSVK